MLSRIHGGEKVKVVRVVHKKRSSLALYHDVLPVGYLFFITRFTT